MKAPRLPARAFPLPYDFGCGSHALLPRSCSPRRSRRAGRSPPGLEHLISRRSAFRLVAPVDASGISQVPWRSVPCLCPTPGPRSSRRDLACGGLVDAAPGFHKPKASADRKISRLTQGFSIRCLRFTSDVAATHARLASGWRAAPLPGGRRTLWTAAKGFRSHFRPPCQDLPCRKWNFPKEHAKGCCLIARRRWGRIADLCASRPDRRWARPRSSLASPIYSKMPNWTPPLREGANVQALQSRTLPGLATRQYRAWSSVLAWRFFLSWNVPFLTAFSPKKRCPFQFVPVIALATCERLR